MIVVLALLGCYAALFFGCLMFWDGHHFEILTTKKWHCKKIQKNQHSNSTSMEAWGYILLIVEDVRDTDCYSYVFCISINLPCIKYFLLSTNCGVMLLQVFGALTSCALKVSDHFYGTGESLLFRFTPEFQVFNWTGDNMYFIKGNNESLAIGAGE